MSRRREWRHLRVNYGTFRAASSTICTVDKNYALANMRLCCLHFFVFFCPFTFISSVHQLHMIHMIGVSESHSLEWYLFALPRLVGWRVDRAARQVHGQIDFGWSIIRGNTWPLPFPPPGACVHYLLHYSSKKGTLQYIAEWWCSRAGHASIQTPCLPPREIYPNTAKQS